MSRIDLPDVSLTALETGDGPTLILVHGSASDHRTWAGQLEAFAPDYRVVSYSRRYHWPNEPIARGCEYAMSEQVEDLLAVLGQFESPAHLLGHSYGASLALLAAMCAPHRVGRLVLAEPPVIPLLTGFPPRPLRILGLLLRQPRTALPIIRFAATGLGPASSAAKRGDLDAAMRRFGRAVLGPEAFDALSAERLEQVRVNFSAEELLSDSYMAPLDADAVRRVTHPTLLVTGAASPTLFHRLTDQLEALLPNAARVEIPGASHVMHEDNAPAFNEAVAGFIER